MGLGIQYQTNENIIYERNVDGVPFLSFSLLEPLPFIHHGFSTRIGGVSEGIFRSMNFTLSGGDKETAVRENFHRITRAMQVDYHSLVLSKQTHTTNVRIVTLEDRGKGVTKPVDYDDVDGMITNVPDICLATFYADCVPLFFVDPEHRAIGLSHSGWRGTVGKIGHKTIELMGKQYGSRPDQILAVIGPSICQGCYEVSEDVITSFREQFNPVYWPELFYQKENGKYQLNLWKANEIILRNAGITSEHLAVTNVCTCCNPEILFSHRASGGRRGNLGAFLAINKEEANDFTNSSKYRD